MPHASVIGTPNTGEIFLGKLTSANMNIDTDQAIPLLVGNKRITRILVVNPSTNLTTAVGGVYSATSKGGYTIVAAAQVYSVLTGAGLELSLTLAKPYFIGATAYLSLTVAQGGAATADVYVFGHILS